MEKSSCQDFAYIWFEDCIEKTVSVHSSNSPVSQLRLAFSQLRGHTTVYRYCK